MGLNINLFVHGVPMGQKIWGPKNDDQSYISSFYGPVWDVPEVMKVDIMNFGGIPYCYYSFVKGKKVYDCQGRAGSYFAITLRINAFYADIQNIYSILKAAYEKMCIGLCVMESDGSVKYICSDFQGIDTQLKAIENSILNYISKFSTDNDIIALKDFSVSGQRALQNINLHECTRNIAIDQIRSSGKLRVSPWYVSIGSAKAIAQYKAETQSVAERAQREIQLQKQTCQDKINEIKKQSQDEVKVTKEHFLQKLAQTRENYEQKISDIRLRYEDYDAKLDTLKRKLREKEQEVNEWHSKYNKKQKETSGLVMRVQELEQRVSMLQDGHDVIYKQSSDQLFSLIRTNWKVVVIIFSIVFVLLISLLLMLGLTKKTQRVSDETKQMDNTISMNKVEKAQKSKNYIVIKDIEGRRNDVDTIVIGKVYQIYFSEQISYKLEGKGQWKSDVFDIGDRGELKVNREKIKKIGNVGKKQGRISYSVEGKDKVSRIITIKE